MQSFQKYPTLESQKGRYLECGYSDCKVIDMYKVYSELIGEEERKRVEKIEWLDEIEEWKMILEHYCVVLAFQDKSKEYAAQNITNFV